LDKPASPGTGPVESARALGATLLALLRVRAELVGVELKEEAERRKQLLILGVVATFFLTASLLLLAFLVVVVFWDTARIPAIAGVTVVYAGIGTWAFLRFRSTARESPPPFSATLTELQKDLDMFQGRDE
jgi:uncharacterized membrane protein YqjE